MAVSRRPAAGGGTVVEIPPERLTGWLTRFAGRNAGLQSIDGGPDVLLVTAGDGTRAELAVPFPPLAAPLTPLEQLTDEAPEPVEALLHHLRGLGALGVVLVRGGAFSIGVVRDGVVLSSSTDRTYLQGRTAAGGWSQQRFARRRGNQRSAGQESAAAVTARMLLPVRSTLSGLVTGGDRESVAAVLADARLRPLDGLPRRDFPDLPEPRRVVLDTVAARALAVEITVRPPGSDGTVPPGPHRGSTSSG